MTPTQYHFTAVGFMVLGIIGIAMAANEKTGPFVIYILLIMILLVVLVHYKQVSGILFKQVGG